MNSHRLIGAPNTAQVRRGSALILVLIMTLSLAGLAMSAIFLSSSAGLLSRYYDRESNYRYAAEAAIALGKSRIQRGDTTLQLLDTGAKLLLSASPLKDASNATIPRVLVNLYGANTGDTVGIYGQFITLLAQAYDSGGTRMVRRLDLTAESFSRFAMFTNTFPERTLLRQRRVHPRPRPQQPGLEFLAVARPDVLRHGHGAPARFRHRDVHAIRRCPECR